MHARLMRLFIAASAVMGATHSASAQVRISQVGKGSGLSPNAYNGNFVELFNAGTEPVSLVGKSLQWASSAASSSWTKFDLSGTIQPGGYWLVRLTATNTGDLNAAFGVPFTADQDRIGFDGTYFSIITATNSGGKVVLADTVATFTTNACAAPDAAHVLDLVSWDDVPSTAACHEGSACALIPVPGPYAGSTAVLRRCGGQSDTNDNLADFVTTARPPRSSVFTGNPLAPAVDGMTQVAGRIERAAATGYAGESALFTSTPTSCAGAITSVSIDLSSIGGTATHQMRDDGTLGDVTPGDGVYSAQFTIPLAATTGFKQLPISATDSVGLTGLGAATITIAPVPPSNDACSSAEVIPAGPLPLFVSATGNLLSASPITQVSTSCTTNGGSAGTSRDLWYAFTPVATALYTVTTCNSVTAPGLFTSQNTVLGIYATCPDESTTAHEGLTLACNDNACSNFIGGSPSTISSFLMEEGVTYLIRVARFGSGSSVVGGPFRLDIISEPFGACCLTNGSCVTTTQSACEGLGGTFWGDGTSCTTVTCPAPPPPSNDACTGALALVNDEPAPGTSYGATGTDITLCDQTSWDVWYTYTPASSAPFTVLVTRQHGAQTPAIAVFDTCPPVADAQLACVTVSTASTTNTLDFSGTPGMTYLIRIATHFSQRSEFTVVIESSEVACNVADLTDVGDSGAGPDGQLTLDDILLFIDEYNDATGCPGVTPCNKADITDLGDSGAGPDGQLTLDDILAFVNAYNDGC